VEIGRSRNAIPWDAADFFLDSGFPEGAHGGGERAGIRVDRRGQFLTNQEWSGARQCCEMQSGIAPLRTEPEHDAAKAVTLTNA